MTIAPSFEIPIFGKTRQRPVFGEDSEREMIDITPKPEQPKPPLQLPAPTR